MHPEDRSIGELAFRLWQARGCPDGTAEQDWLEAEKQLQASRPARPRSSEAVDDSLESTFPASDPPASHLPDVPPANAAAKWKAAEAASAKPRTEPSRAEPSRAEPSRAEPSRAEPSRAEPSRTEPSRARAEPSGKSPPRRRSQTKADLPLPGENKPTSLSKPRNDRAS